MQIMRVTMIKKKVLSAANGQQRLARNGRLSLPLATDLPSISTLPSPVVETIPRRDPTLRSLVLIMFDPVQPSLYGRSRDQKGGLEPSKNEAQSLNEAQAYIIGKNNQEYDHIIAHVSAMVFLATPHRGSAFAAMLNNILKASPGGTKNYVAELERQSGSLQDINELFRNICGDLKLVSFHETIKTNIGAGIKKMASARYADSSVAAFRRF
ncbi:MAG: hypothetical protein Q9173_004742 [Seirophora scorigena]